MKSLVLAATLLGAGLAQGCIISSDDDDGGGGGGGDPSPCNDEELSGGPGACVQVLVDCPINATTFEVTGLGTPRSEDCSVGELPIVVSPGTYDLVVTPFDDLVEFPSRGETIDVVDDEILTVDYVIGAGEIALEWTIDGLPADDPSCTDIGGDEMTLLATFADTTEGIEFAWPCEDGSGITNPMELDDYVVSVAMVFVAGDPIVFEPENVSLIDDGEVADLGSFEVAP